MGHWVLDWSDCYANQCWEELWLLWHLDGVTTQLQNKRIELRSTNELDSEYGEWMNWGTGWSEGSPRWQRNKFNPQASLPASD